MASGTTSKQLSSERDARLVGFGSMLIESALGIASLIAVGYIFTQNGHAFTSQTPTQVLADGLSQMLACVGLGSESARGVTYGLIILAVSTFCLTSLDTATRLGRYMFQELWLAPGQSVKDVRGWRAVLVNKYVATLVTVGLGMSLGFGGYAKIWPLFGAANQLLAALALLAVACWLQNLARRNGMFLLPMLFMLLVTLSALVLGIVAQGRALLAGTGGAVAALQLVIAVLLLALTNQVLSAVGKPVLPIESENLEQLVTAGITIGASLWAWWKNNSFTGAAQEADKYMAELKEGGE